MKAQTIAVIRGRGQLTIPESIRGVFKWVNPASVVTLTIEKPDEIIIRPHRTKRQIDWGEIWNKVKLSRSFIGKRGNLSEFIFEDRARR